MTSLPKALFAAVAATALAGVAHADLTPKATFKFATDQSAEEIYTNFEKTSRKACQDFVQSMGRQPLSTKAQVESRCRADLMERAVKQTKLPRVIAYHAEQNGDVEPQVFAGQ